MGKLGAKYPTCPAAIAAFGFEGSLPLAARSLEGVRWKKKDKKKKSLGSGLSLRCCETWGGCTSVDIHSEGAAERPAGVGRLGEVLK